MLDIYQGFYKNIGPLKNEGILVNYKEGKSIIYGPIGAGKSFLFFDGPSFGLYKNIKRTITNKDSKEGEVQILFSVDENFYLVIRTTKLTNKGKDSVKTYLYTIEKNKQFIDFLEETKNKETLVKNNDILTLLNFNQVVLQDLTKEYKQEGQLQNALDSLLPPYEVFASTILISQDSENIFEVDNSKRIEILKNVFGISGIDIAKEIINDRKKDTYSMIKAKEDKENYQRKLKIYTKNILENIENIKGSIESQDIEKIKETISFDENFETNLERIQKIEVNLEKIIKKNRDKIEKILQNNEKLKIYKENKEKNILKIENIEKEIKEIEGKISEIENENKKHDKDLEEKNNKESEILKIKGEIKEINSTYPNLEEEYDKFLEHLNNLKFEEKKLKEIKLQIEENIKEIDKINLELKQREKKENGNLKLEKEKLEKENDLKINFEEFNFEDEKATSIKDLERIFDNITTKGKFFTEKLENLEKQEKDNLEKLGNIKKQIENEKKEIKCPKCGEIINLEEKEGNYFLKEKESLEKSIKTLNKETQEIKGKIESLRNYRKEKNITQIKKKIDKYWENEDKIKKIILELDKNQKENENILTKKLEKESLEKITKKLEEDKIKKEQDIGTLKKKINLQIEKNYQNKINLTKKLEKEKENIDLLNSNLESNEKNKQLQNNLENKITELKKNKENEENEINNIEKDIKTIEEILSKVSINKLKENDSNLSNLKENISIFNNFVDDYNKNKLDLINLKEEYKILRELINIFSRELVIYVFKDYLGSLEELINYFLETVVEFKLHIELDEKGENLDIFVEDKKGKREVKSLSGGQKNALKIGWILGINKLKKSKMLFLDETINNFDQQSIQMISERIKIFTEENNLKFYMVTHSEILQQMNIWTNEVFIDLKEKFENLTNI